MQRYLFAILSAVLIVQVSGVAFGQQYPAKLIRIVAVEPGGSSDFAARLIAQGLTSSLGYPVIVENRGGGGGIIAAQTVAKAVPDGYTLLFWGNAFWLLPFLQDQVPYDPLRDFSAITWATRSPNFLVVHPSVPVNSVKALIALARARPGELNYGSSGPGSSNHLAAELFKSMAQVNIVRIPYKGSAQALNDVIAGQVQLMFATAGTMAPHVKSGRLKALAVTALQPSSLAPDLPTMSASGVPGYESETMIGMFAPAGISASLVSLLNDEIVKVLNSPDSKERLFRIGIEAVGSSPEQFSSAIKSEMTRLGKVIKDANIRAE